MYGKVLILLMLAFCLTEVMDNQIRPLAFQGIFMMYLYVGSIVAIMCIYITVLLDNCPSITGRNSREPLTNHDGNGDPESGSLTSFGTLRRAHIDRNKVSRTSFYLRVGALGKFNDLIIRQLLKFEVQSRKKNLSTRTSRNFWGKSNENEQESSRNRHFCLNNLRAKHR